MKIFANLLMNTRSKKVSHIQIQASVIQEYLFSFQMKTTKNL